MYLLMAFMIISLIVVMDYQEYKDEKKAEEYKESLRYYKTV